MANDFNVPLNLRGPSQGEVFDRWLQSLPSTVARVAAAWNLDLGPPFQPGGRTAWVAPASRHGDGEPLVLKVAWRHIEAEDEATGLREWDGDGTVRLYDVDEHDDTVALLLERCVPGVPLTVVAGERQDEVVADLLRRLWRPPANDYRTLAAMCHEWADHFEAYVGAGGAQIDPGLAREGAALFRTLSEPHADDLLLVTDLHADNVLTAEREPWLVIDPKPHVGDRTYDVLQHMLNRRDRLHGDPRAFVGDLADRLDLDPERLRLWLFARCVIATRGWPELATVARALA